MHNHTGNPAITIVSPPTFSHISDGDELDEGHLNPTEEQQDDYIAALLQGKQETVSVTKWFTDWRYKQDDNARQPQWVHFQDGTDRWLFQGNSAAAFPNIPNNYGRLEGYVDMRIELPHGCLLTQLDVYLIGPGPHDGTPINKPKVKLVRVDHTSSLSALTTLIDKQDASPDFATYEARHAIDATTADMPGATAITWDAAKKYSLIFLPEGWDGTGTSQTHCLAGTILGAARATFTTSVLDRRAA